MGHWRKSAQRNCLPGLSKRNGPTGRRNEPSTRHLPDLAALLIERGLDNGWDFAASSEWPSHPSPHHHVGTPHAFAYLLRRVMEDRAVPMLPIITNTFFPPNQPRPWRCFALGELVYRVLMEWKKDVRVAVFGSGGMTHFVINEEFDHALIKAIQSRDAAFLKAISPSLMKDGTSELLNWVSASGCLFQTQLSGELIDYVPCYRTEAGHRDGAGLLRWSAMDTMTRTMLVFIAHLTVAMIQRAASTCDRSRP